MQINYITNRLILDKLQPIDAQFMQELLNTDEWIKYIGDRQIKTHQDAQNYIQKIMEDANTNYWIVKLKANNTAIGIITFIKRTFLDHYDIGFAFLPKFFYKGYAYESSLTVLKDLLNDPMHHYILAKTKKENKSSIKLLEKLGLKFEKEITHNNQQMLLYSIKANVL